MLKRLLCVILLLSSLSLVAQIEFPNNTPTFEPLKNDKEPPTGFDIPSTSKTPSLTIPREERSNTDFDLGKEDKKDFSMVEDEYLEHKSKLKPRFFKDREAKPEYGEDMYLGDISTNSKKVTILYRDHEYVDGDRIRVYVNDEMMVANVMLEGDFQGFDLPLEDGFNKIEFEALNQGTSGPNTAQLQILDEAGELLGSYVWNLLTGHKATAIVVKRSL